MLISKRPIKLAAIVMSLIPVAAISAPSAIAASTIQRHRYLTAGPGCSHRSYRPGNITYDPNVAQMVDNELDPDNAHTVQFRRIPFIR